MTGYQVRGVPSGRRGCGHHIGHGPCRVAGGGPVGSGRLHRPAGGECATWLGAVIGRADAAPTRCDPVRWCTSCTSVTGKVIPRVLVDDGLRVMPRWLLGVACCHFEAALGCSSYTKGHPALTLKRKRRLARDRCRCLMGTGAAGPEAGPDWRYCCKGRVTRYHCWKDKMLSSAVPCGPSRARGKLLPP